MTIARLASIIINNYNYAGFLREAIESALNQTYRDKEVIVVDDGSTDGSHQVIMEYRDRIIPVFKENGGQTSALNSAFRICRGEVVHFVDADDALLPTAVERAMQVCRDPDVAKVHWPLREIDAYSRETGKVWCEDLPDGDLREALLIDGPDSIHHPPTTGNAFARWFLEKVFPMPEARAVSALGADCADSRLCGLVPLYGRIATLPEPQAYYRVHGQNGYSCLGFEERLRRDVIASKHLCDVVAEHCSRVGVQVDREQWTRKSWAHRIRRAMDDIAALVSPGEAFILVDEDTWKTDSFLAGRKRIPCLEHDGRYWGNPPDDATAILEIERLREVGAKLIVFAWPAFWWFDYYLDLYKYLCEQFPLIHRDELIVVFDLRERLQPCITRRAWAI